MQLSKICTFITALGALLVFTSGARAEVEIQQRPGDVTRVRIIDDNWRPDGFQEGLVIPAAYAGAKEIFLDGKDSEPAWSEAEEIEVPLSFGSVQTAWVKALYSDTQVMFRVRWADPTEDRQHHPWVWDEDLANYVEGPQAEDSLMFSFESGCEWFPSFLAGYAFDFDAWHWMAARTDPIGHALDLSGSMKDTQLSMNTLYPTRHAQDQWNLRFIDTRDGILNSHWEDLDRQFMLWPNLDEVYFHANFDGSRGRDFRITQPPAERLPSSPAQLPKFEPLDLEGRAADVQAKGHWENGFWTIELRRTRVTEDGIGTDMQFTRLTQFSLHVFDAVEHLDQSSESGRLWLKFMENEPDQAARLAAE